MGLGSMALKTISIADPALSYIGYRKEGDSVGSSVGKAALEFAAWELAAPLMFGKMAVDIGSGIANVSNTIGRQNASTSSKAYGSNFGGNYKDTQNAYTMRQRGIQAIQRNGMNARSVLGSEARQYIRGGY